jgi:hypothetical protein
MTPAVHVEAEAFACSNSSFQSNTPSVARSMKSNARFCRSDDENRSFGVVGRIALFLTFKASRKPASC